MQSNRGNQDLKRVYYVYGSGLFAVPAERVNELGQLKLEHHAREARAAIAVSAIRRVA
jgi:hypothetical protein